MKLFKVLHFLLVANAIGAVSARADNLPPTHFIEVRTSSHAVRTRLVEMGYALEEFRSDKVFFYGKEKDLARITSLGLMAKAYPLSEEWKRFDTMAVPTPPTSNTKFHSYSEVVQELETLQAQYPNIVTITSLGRSFENRDVPMLRISGRTPGEAQAQGTPVAFYMGCHHAREHLSVEVPLKFAKHLASKYGVDPEVTRLVDSREIYIAPIVNPDGHVYDYVDGHRGRMWRKNRRPNGNGDVGTDLNRNYGYMWGSGGASPDTGDETYRGPAAFSEIETQNVRNFVDSQPRMKTLLTFHTFSELILYPWGHTRDAIGPGGGEAADLPVFERMARDMSVWNHYTPEPSSTLYISSGDTVDWAYGTHGIFAFTFELSPASQFEGGFYPSPDIADPTFEANLKPMMYLLEYSDNPHRVLTGPAPTFDRSPAQRGLALASPRDLRF